VDIHLNPKIGLDWMCVGATEEAKTPGQTEALLAGALDVRTGVLCVGGGERKTSYLFLDLSWIGCVNNIRKHVVCI